MKKNVFVLIGFLSMIAVDCFAVMPQDVLPDGIDIIASEQVNLRKGSIGATLANLKRLQSCLTESKACDKVSMNEIKEHLHQAIPVLIQVGLFDLFPLHEWHCPLQSDPLYEAKHWFANEVDVVFVDEHYKEAIRHHQS